MAQTGFTPISQYYSTTAAAVPTAGNLVNGELALNITDGKIFYKDNAGVVQVIGTKGGVGSSTTTQVLYNSSGLVVGSANLTFNGTTLTTANDASISGLTVGKGGASGGSGGNSTALGLNVLPSANSSSYNNTAVGSSALNALTSGNSNSAFGLNSLSFTTTGSNNTAIGTQALNLNTTASNNTAVGYQAGYSNTTGADNTYNGYQAGNAVTTGTRNALFGHGAGSGVTTGSYNTGIGSQTFVATLTGSENSALGYGAAYSMTSGQYNTAIGRSALFSNTTASSNTAVGYQAGYSNTTGSITALGYTAGYGNTTGAYNCAIGDFAGVASTTASGQAFFGSNAGQNTTGGSSTFVGSGAGYLVTTGAKNTIVGRFTGNQGGLDIRTASNYIVLSDGDGNPQMWIQKSGNDWTIPNTLAYGHLTSTGSYVGTLRCSGSNNIVVRSASGADAVYIASGATSWTSSSDERLKENLEPIQNGLEKVCSLRSVTGNFIADTEKKSKAFLIAQDVQAVLPQAISNDEEGYLGVAYTDTIPLLVAAIKELKAEVDSLKQQLGK